MTVLDQNGRQLQETVTSLPPVDGAVSSNVADLNAFLLAQADRTYANGEHVLLTAQASAWQNTTYIIVANTGGTTATLVKRDRKYGEGTLVYAMNGTNRGLWQLLTRGDIYHGLTSLSWAHVSSGGGGGGASSEFLAGSDLGDADVTLYSSDGEEHTLTGTLTAERSVTLSPYGATQGQLKVITVETAQAHDLNILNGGADGDIYEQRIVTIPAGRSMRVICECEDPNIVGESANWAPLHRRYLDFAGDTVDPGKWGRLILRMEPGASTVSLTGALADSVSNLAAEFTGSPLTSSGAARPTYGATAWNGVAPGLTFGGTHYMQANGIAAEMTGADKRFYWIAAVQLTAVATGKYLWSFGNSTDGDPLLVLRTSSTSPEKLTPVVAQDSGAQTAVDGSTNLTTDRMIVEVWTDETGTLINSAINGVNDIVAQGFDRDTHTFDRFTLGALGRAAIAAHVSATYGGMLLYDGFCSATMRANARRYITVTKGWSV